MRKQLSLIIGFLAVITVIGSFFGMGEKTTMFSFEVNTWVYRLSWVLIAGWSLYDYYQLSKETSD